MNRMITKERYVALLGGGTSYPIDDVSGTSLVVSGTDWKRYFLLDKDGENGDTSISHFELTADKAFEILASYVKAVEEKQYGRFLCEVDDAKLEFINAPKINLSDLFKTSSDDNSDSFANINTENRIDLSGLF